MFTLSRMAVILACLGAMLLALVLVPPGAQGQPTVEPELRLDPAHGPDRIPFDAQARGFLPGERVPWYWDGDELEPFGAHGDRARGAADEYAGSNDHSTASGGRSPAAPLTDSNGTSAPDERAVPDVVTLELVDPDGGGVSGWLASLVPVTIFGVFAGRLMLRILTADTEAE